MDDTLDLSTVAPFSGPITESCGNCRALWEKGSQLWCRRRSPQVQVMQMPGQQMINGKVQQVMQTQILGQYPPTSKDQWCGDWLAPLHTSH